MTSTKFYSAKEAADAVCCSTTFIYQLLKTGELPDYRVGNRHYILKQAVQEYIDGNIVAAVLKGEKDKK